MLTAHKKISVGINPLLSGQCKHMTKVLNSKKGGNKQFLYFLPAVCFAFSLLWGNYLHCREVAIKYYPPESEGMSRLLWAGVWACRTQTLCGDFPCFSTSCKSYFAFLTGKKKTCVRAVYSNILHIQALICLTVFVLYGGNLMWCFTVPLLKLLQKI